MTWMMFLLLNSSTPCISTKACVCLSRALEDDRLAAKDIVVGRVLRTRMVPGPAGYPEQEAVLLVTATWKGAALRDTLTVRDIAPGSDCSVGLIENWFVLVFTRHESGRVLAQSCRRSRPVDILARGALDSLGPPRAGQVEEND